MNHTLFSPLGTVSARAEFQRWAPEAQEAHDAQTIGALVALAQGFDISEEIFFLAWELLRVQRGLAGQHQRAALVLVLAVVIHMQRGSTCLPLGPQGPLPALLSSLIDVEDPQATHTPEDVAAQVDLWMGQIQRLIQANALDDIVGEPGSYKPLILDGQTLFPQRLRHYEARLIEALSARWLQQQPSIQTDGVDAALTDIMSSPPMGNQGAPITLTAEQQYAVLSSVHQAWTWITGGPGTGKTSIVVSILRLAARLGVEPTQVALAAPTGKAAHRMTQSIGGQLSALDGPSEADRALMEQLPKAQTLHRLLGYIHQAARYQHHEHNPLDATLVIVDEASMIDLFLMEHLLRAVRPNAHVIFLGDADQLPSVDSGAVFRDMIARTVDTHTPWAKWVDPPLDVTRSDDPMGAFTVRLTESFRMSDKNPDGRRILQAAGHVRRGESRALLSGGLTRLDALDAIEHRGMELFTTQIDPDDTATLRAQLGALCERWYVDHIRPPQGFKAIADDVLRSFDGQGFESEQERARVRALFAHMQRTKLLCLTRVFFTGSVFLNELLLDMMRAEMGTARASFVAGQPVMMLRNDYDKGIFNGDQAIILPVQVVDGVELMAVFDHEDGPHAFTLDAVRKHLATSFAMTVHKSQGSEFEHVALVLPVEPMPLLTRELLYTGMTRASKSVLLWGAQEALEHAVDTPERRDGAVRASFEAMARATPLDQK